MPNRLADESSPYLLQHQNNPVDWHPWSEEALSLARQQQRPIFLSIGYSACHWCHVMEHESFENQEIANILNERFICIKVDREERPDLDQIYMNAVQLLTGQGGWPMSVFLTPDLQPYYAGTYFPPTPQRGMPGFGQVAEAVYEAWEQRQEAVKTQAAEITSRLQLIGTTQPGESAVDAETLMAAGRHLEKIFDFTHGGFGSAPKFPHTMDLELLLRLFARFQNDTYLDMVQLNLDKMYRGGIYDHLAGGFARYSVDARWLVPHFEKMLYDNALLAGVYVSAYLVTDEPTYAQVARETFGYILSYMTDECGGFHSAEDADSEGVEGKFYVWRPDEIHKVLGADLADRFCRAYDITQNGNFEGNNIPNLPQPLTAFAQKENSDITDVEQQLSHAKQELLAVRDARIRPGKDDKVLVSWNALMIEALARGGGALEVPEYVAAACKAGDFIWQTLRNEHGRLLHSYRGGQAKFSAYLDDYSYLANAFVTLYEQTWEGAWLDRALELTQQMLEHFRDPEIGDFFYTADDHEQLIARNKDVYDNSVPSGASMAATVLLRLGRLTGNQEYVDTAATTIQGAGDVIERSPSAAGQMLVAADHLLGPACEIVLVAKRSDKDLAAVEAKIRGSYIPGSVYAFLDPDHPDATPDALAPLTTGKVLVDNEIALYVCQGFACQAPVAGAAAILAAVDELAVTSD